MSVLYFFYFHKSANFVFFLSYNDRDQMKGKGNMERFISKKEFYRMMLRDRLPVAEIRFPIDKEDGRIEFFTCPMGLIVLASIGKGRELGGIKLYSEQKSRFLKLNLFCGDNFVCLEGGVFVCVLSSLQIADIIGREFLISIGTQTIIARAQMIPKRLRVVDKSSRLVYN